MKLAWVLVILGSVIGGFMLLNVFAATGISAPQEAAGAGMALACAAIPYCFVRAIQFMCESPEAAELKTLNDTLTTHTRLLAELANNTKAPEPEPAAMAATATGETATSETRPAISGSWPSLSQE